VPPAYTSQTCSGCGVLVAKGLSVRWHSCPDCGTSLHRDHNAAKTTMLRRTERGAGRAFGEGLGYWPRRTENPWGFSPGGVSNSAPASRSTCLGAALSAIGLKAQ
jgi:transposase